MIAQESIQNILEKVIKSMGLNYCRFCNSENITVHVERVDEFLDSTVKYKFIQECKFENKIFTIIINVPDIDMIKVHNSNDMFEVLIMFIVEEVNWMMEKFKTNTLTELEMKLITVT